MNRLKTLSEKGITMHRFLMISAFFLIASCAAPAIEYRNVTPDVPAELRQPVELPQRKAETLADVGVILADHVQGLNTANGRIVAIDAILTEAEAR